VVVPELVDLANHEVDIGLVALELVDAQRAAL
jgi:hypothetical protein